MIPFGPNAFVFFFFFSLFLFSYICSLVLSWRQLLIEAWTVDFGEMIATAEHLYRFVAGADGSCPSLLLFNISLFVHSGIIVDADADRLYRLLAGDDGSWPSLLLFSVTVAVPVSVADHLRRFVAGADGSCLLFPRFNILFVVMAFILE